MAAVAVAKRELSKENARVNRETTNVADSAKVIASLVPSATDAAEENKSDENLLRDKTSPDCEGTHASRRSPLRTEQK